MIRLDKHGRVLSGGFDGESLPFYADEVTHGLGEAKPAGEKVRSQMAKLSANRLKKVKDAAIARAIDSKGKEALKNLVQARRLSAKAAKSRKIENAKAKLTIAASKQRTLGFDFSGLIGDPLAGFDDTATIVASQGLLGEGLYDDVIEGEDFGNTMFGAAPKKKIVAKTLSQGLRSMPKVQSKSATSPATSPAVKPKPTLEQTINAATKLAPAAAKPRIEASIRFDFLLEDRKKHLKDSPEEKAITDQLQKIYDQHFSESASKVNINNLEEYIVYRAKKKAKQQKEVEEKQKLEKLAKEAGVGDLKTAKMLGEKKLKELKRTKDEKKRDEQKYLAIASSKLRPLKPGEDYNAEEKQLSNIFFCDAALDDTYKIMGPGGKGGATKGLHDTSRRFRDIISLVERRLRWIDEDTDKAKKGKSDKQKKALDNNRDFIKNKYEKAKVDAIKRTLKWREKNGKCGILGLDCVYPPSPALIIGAVALIVATVVTVGAAGGIAAAASSVASGASAVAGTVTGATTAVTTAATGAVSAGLGTVGLGAAAPLAGLGVKAAVGAGINAGINAIVPKEVQQGINIVQGGAQMTSDLASGKMQVPSGADLANAAKNEAESRAKREIENRTAQAAAQAGKLPSDIKAKGASLSKQKRDEVVKKTKQAAQTAATKELAAKTKLPESTVKKIAQGQAVPSVPPTTADMIKKQVKNTEEAALAEVQAKTGIPTGVSEDPRWDASDITKEVSPQQLRAGGFAPAQSQAQLANMAENLDVKIADAPNTSLTAQQRQELSKEVAKAEYERTTQFYQATIAAAQRLTAAQKAGASKQELAKLELEFAEANAQYDKAKLQAGVKVAAAAQGRYSVADDLAHPLLRFF